jgi:O-antigen ligase
MTEPRSKRFAFLCLLAALAAPALLVLPRSAHPFDTGPAFALPFFAVLAAGLAWRGAGAPLPRRWAWGLGLLVLAWLGYELALLPKIESLLKHDLSPQRPWMQRVSLAVPALLLAWQAWRGPWSPRLPASGQRLGLALAAWLCLSGAQSLRPDLALNALSAWGSYGLLFLAAWLLADTRESRRKVVLLLLAVGALNALYAVVQAVGKDPMPWNQGFNGRAMGFLGNPNFLGGHLALLWPLSLALALDGRGDARARSYRWLLAGLLGLGLLLTQTRGAWAGAAVGLGFLAWALMRRAPGLLARRRGPLLAGLALALVFGGLSVATQPQLRARLASVLSGKDVEASRRAFLMRKSAQLALRWPLLGVGPGNFRILFPSVQVQGLAPADYAAQPYVLSEHSHNDLLQMAADAGLPAALAWLSLLILCGLALWRRSSPAAGARSQPESLLILGALASLIALNVHGLANFPFLILPTEASAFVLAALALSAAYPPLSSDDGLVDAEAPQTGLVTSDPPPATPVLKPWVSASLILLPALLLAWRAGRGLVGEGFWWMGEGELGLSNHDLASGILLRSLDFDRQEDRLWRLHGRAEFDKGLNWNSIGSFREALRLNPYDAESGVRLGRALVENNVLPEASEVLQQVANYAPNFIDVWEPLAASLYQQGKYAEAIKAYDWMIFFKINIEAAYANKAACLGNLGQLPEALMVLKAAELQLPDNGKIQLNLAITYFKLGLKAEARNAWKNALRLSPSDPQVDQMRKLFR